MRDALGLFAGGHMHTFDWALEAEAVGTVEPRTFVRRLACPQLYTTPNDTWQQVWRKASGWLGKCGEYNPSVCPLDVWAQCDGGHSIESASPLERWPELARSLVVAPPISTGIVAVRTNAAGPLGYPGMTVVLETPSGGADGALMLVDLLGQQGISGLLANQAEGGRWGIVKLIYSPSWYAADEERNFGVDWARWVALPDDQNESKRLWCEHAALAVSKVMQELPPLCIDSLFFDEHAATDRLWLLSKPAVRHLCAVSHERLAAELARLSAEPLPLSDLQQHWNKIAPRKRMAEMLENGAFWDEVQRLSEVREGLDPNAREREGL